MSKNNDDWRKDMIKGIEWRCGNCGKIYSTTELLKLEKIKAVESDINPSHEHGYTPVCTCGYRFHLDRWRLNDIQKIKIEDRETYVIISTVYLELNNGFFDKDLWYETGIFMCEENGNIIDDLMLYESRYEKKEEAIADHNKILELLKSGKYEIHTEEKRYNISFEQDE